MEVLVSIFIPLPNSSLNLSAPMFSNMTMETEPVYSLIISITMFPPHTHTHCGCWESLGLVPSIDSQFYVVFFFHQTPRTQQLIVNIVYMNTLKIDWPTWFSEISNMFFITSTELLSSLNAFHLLLFHIFRLLHSVTVKTVLWISIFLPFPAISKYVFALLAGPIL